MRTPLGRIVKMTTICRDAFTAECEILQLPKTDMDLFDTESSVELFGGYSIDFPEGAYWYCPSSGARDSIAGLYSASRSGNEVRIGDAWMALYWRAWRLGEFDDLKDSKLQEPQPFEYIHDDYGWHHNVKRVLPWRCAPNAWLEFDGEDEESFGRFVAAERARVREIVLRAGNGIRLRNYFDAPKRWTKCHYDTDLLCSSTKADPTMWVYVIREADGDRVKIGMSRDADPTSRVMSHVKSSSQGRHLQPVALLRGSDNLESVLHKRFASLLIPGKVEWFHERGEMAIAVQDRFRLLAVTVGCEWHDLSSFPKIKASPCAAAGLFAA